MSMPLLASQPAQALLRDEDRANLGKINTNVYVWGEGFQSDLRQDYSNFTPKKVKQFKGADKPNAVDIAFGWYHEAYIDAKGTLRVCAKAKVPSVEVEGLVDGDRPDLVEVTSLPRGTKVRQVAFTQSRMFVLSEKGDVYVYRVEEHLPSRDTIAQFGRAGPASQIQGELMIFDKPKKVKDVGVIKQMACGLDHVVLLDKKGGLFAMGDDTFGQCGTGGEGRATTAPFNEARHGAPVKVELPRDSKGKPQPVKKVVCGFRHTLAITENGKLYGWGSNSQQQLSHAAEYADESSPVHAWLSPQRVMGPLAELFVVDAAAGEEFSVIVAQGKKAGTIHEQVYACGNNLKGSLGINRTSHVQDLTLVPDLSDLFDENDQARMINHLQCGRRHCIATFDFGAFVFWGDNHVGQLGNRKRSFVESPFPSPKFQLRHNVENVVLGIDSSGVIVEDTGRVRKKKKKKNKRILKKDEVIKSEEDLRRRSEALVIKETEDREKLDGRGRRSVIDRVRSRVLQAVYGQPAADAPQSAPGQEAP